MYVPPNGVLSISTDFYAVFMLLLFTKVFEKPDEGKKSLKGFSGKLFSTNPSRQRDLSTN